MNENSVREYVQKMYAILATGNGTCDRALREISRRSGVSVTMVKHIHQGKSKVTKVPTAFTLRDAYTVLIEEQLAKITAEVANEQRLTEQFEPVFYSDEIQALRKKFADIRERIAA